MGFKKLKTDVHLNMVKMDELESKADADVEKVKSDLSKLHEDNEFLQAQIYGGVGAGGIFLIVLILLGVCLCCFLKKRFATFVRV